MGRARTEVFYLQNLSQTRHHPLLHRAYLQNLRVGDTDETTNQVVGGKPLLLQNLS